MATMSDERYSTLDMFSPRQQSEAGRIKKWAGDNLKVVSRLVTDPMSRINDIGENLGRALAGDPQSQDRLQQLVLGNVAQAMTDPMMGTFVPAKGMEAGAFTDLLSKKTMREIADNGSTFRLS